MCRSPMEFTGCIIGTIFLGLLTSLQDNQQTGLLTFYVFMTDAFLSGATICISIITCDIGKNVMKQHG